MPRKNGKDVPTGGKKGVPKTPSEWSVFLEELAKTGNVSQAAETAKISRLTIYHKYRRDPEFAKAMDEAKETGYERLEDEAYRRAHDGVLEPVFYQGEEVGEVRRYSDALLMFLLKGSKPKRYRDRMDANITGDPAALAAAMFKAAQAMEASTDQKDTRE